MKNYDVVIVGGGAGGLFAAYEFVKMNTKLKVALIEKGKPLHERKCPIDGDKIKNCRFSGAVSAIENCNGRKFDFFEFLFRENFERINSVVACTKLV